ncbi:UNVERIFIED_CONTAM: DNA mismatch repair protein [Siphonaria sp. JEL0065]|nr:DNA mismatch repair protein [Siphonaria sp. JEL0065]
MVPVKAGGSADAKPTAGNVGTQILIEDLFFNVPIRKKALKGSAEEYNRIVDIVGSNSADFRSNQGTTREAIRQVYGPAVAKELVEIEHSNDELEFKINAIVSNANYNMKKMVFLLFINHRAVESSNIKRALENLYSSYLPKNSHAFCYISLEMKPQNLDVNEVMFLNEEKVIESLCNTIKEKLAGVNDSRMFKPAQIVTSSVKLAQITTSDCAPSKPKPIIPVATYRKEHEMVRTDSRLQTLDAFIKSNPSFSKPITPVTQEPNRPATHPIMTLPPLDEPFTPAQQQQNTPGRSMETQSEPSQPEGTRKELVDVQLTSVLNLRERVSNESHPGLTDLFRNHTLVGPVDDKWMLLQYQTKLYIIDVEDVSCLRSPSREFFYQLVLHGFSNFGYLHLSEPVSIYELVMMALNEEASLNPEELETLQDPESIATQIVQMFIDRREMLQEYFSMVVLEDGTLMSLPVLLKGYEPNLGKLPLFLIRLGTEVDWETEEGCFDSFAHELGIFFACEPPYNQTDPDAIVEDGRAEKGPDNVGYKWELEHVVFKSMRQWYLPSRELSKRESVVQVVDLPDLYKVFERC